MDFHSWNSVLLKTHGWNKKAVDDVLGAQMQVHGAAYGNNYGCCENVVVSGGIAGINAQRIAFVWASKLLCVCFSEDSIFAGIAEIPLKLRARNLNVDLPALFGGRHHARPQMVPGNIE